MSRVFTSLIIVAALGASAATASAECKRWHNNVDPCLGIVAAPACNFPSSWTEVQERNYNNWHLSSTPYKACEKMIRKSIVENPDVAFKCPLEGAAGPKLFHYGTWQVASPPYTADGYFCTCNRNDDNVTTTADLSYDLFPIDNLIRQPQPICSLVPNGPYAMMPGRFPATSGGKFSDTLRIAIRDKNFADHGGAAFTDFVNINGHTDPETDIWVTRETYLPYNDDNDLDDEMDFVAMYGNSLQIDHIIPRKDIQGCNCGSNSKANALVISGLLNAQMSNLTEDERRRAILDEWTNWTPGDPLIGDASGLDDVPDDETIATANGCSATGGDGLALGALALFLRRRRRSQPTG